MGQGDYPLAEFVNRLATVEDKYAKEIQNLVECFASSRLDLPVKKLEDLGRVRVKTGRYLKKAVDPKKNDAVNLWKLCNVYSATAVDIDDAMREIRAALRKRLKRDPLVSKGQQDVSAFRKLVDEYRPANRRTEPPQEIYDQNKPTLKEKQRWLDLGMFKRNEKKEEKRPQPGPDAEKQFTQYMVEAVKAQVNEERRTIRPSQFSEKEIIPTKLPITTRPIAPPRPSVMRPKSLQTVPTDTKRPMQRTPSPTASVHNINNTPKEIMKSSSSLVLSSSDKTTVHKIRSRCDKSLIGNCKDMETAAQEQKLEKQQTMGKILRDRQNADMITLHNISPTMIQVEQIDSKALDKIPKNEKKNMFKGTNIAPLPERRGVLAQRHSIKIAMSGSSDEDEKRSVIQRSVDRSQSMCTPRITNGRIQRFQPEALPPKPRLHAQIMTSPQFSSSDEDSSAQIDRL